MILSVLNDDDDVVAQNVPVINCFDISDSAAITESNINLPMQITQSDG